MYYAVLRCCEVARWRHWQRQADNQNNKQKLFPDVLMSVTAEPRGLTLKSEQETLVIRHSVGFGLKVEYWTTWRAH